jgi:hypothetical protein
MANLHHSWSLFLRRGTPSGSIRCGSNLMIALAFMPDTSWTYRASVKWAEWWPRILLTVLTSTLSAMR